MNRGSLRADSGGGKRRSNSDVPLASRERKRERLRESD